MSERDKKDKNPGSRIYRQPVLVLYKLNGEYCAQLAHPTKPVPVNAIKRAKEGPQSVIGKWLDLGYTFGSKREVIPEWLKLPKEAEFVFCQSITHVPLTI